MVSYDNAFGSECQFVKLFTSMCADVGMTTGPTVGDAAVRATVSCYLLAVSMLAPAGVSAAMLVPGLRQRQNASLVRPGDVNIGMLVSVHVLQDSQCSVLRMDGVLRSKAMR